jgi:hypothetical protein
MCRDSPVQKEFNKRGAEAYIKEQPRTIGHPKNTKCEFCDADAVEFVGRKVRLCQKHISECLSLYYQNERR